MPLVSMLASPAGTDLLPGLDQPAEVAGAFRLLAGLFQRPDDGLDDVQREELVASFDTIPELPDDVFRSGPARGQPLGRDP